MQNLVDYINENAGYAIMKPEKYEKLYHSDSYCVVTLDKTSQLFVDGFKISVRGGIPTKLYPTKELVMDKAAKHLLEFDGSHLDTSKFTSFWQMFADANQLKKIDLSNWDTSNVTSTGMMFYRCDNLESINLSGWDTRKLTSMTYMFGYCQKLKDLKIDKWDTSHVAHIDHAFVCCSKLTDKSIGKHLDLSSVNKWYNAFASCPAFSPKDYPDVPEIAFHEKR